MSDPTGPSGIPAPDQAPQCYRHAGKETWIRCQRCERPICPDCMREAAVGFQCPECVARGAKETRTGRTAYGGRVSSNPQGTVVGLIALNVAVWLAVTATGGISSLLAQKLMLTSVGRCLTQNGEGWYRGAEQGVCAVYGGVWQAGAAEGAWWQLMTHGFVHVDLMHLALNCLALWILGPVIEEALGRTRFLALYLLATFAAGVTILWFAAPTSSTLGASGGVFGLMGALLVLFAKRRGDVRGVLLLLALNGVVTFTVPHISWQGHLGGLVGGALAAAVLIWAPRASRTLWQALGLAVLVGVLLALCAVRVLQLL